MTLCLLQFWSSYKKYLLLLHIRALCRIKLLPVTHVLVDTWMLTVELVYKLSNCAWWPEMGYKHTYDTIYTHFQGITNNIYGFGRPFISLLLHFLPVHPYFYPSIFVFTRPNGGWTSLYIKLCFTCWRPVRLCGITYMNIMKDSIYNLYNQCYKITDCCSTIVTVSRSDAGDTASTEGELPVDLQTDLAAEGRHQRASTSDAQIPRKQRWFTITLSHMTQDCVLWCWNNKLVVVISFLSCV